jgi:4-amino-4-deoxy-L-arabinose transferase-like glycosyltransferase
VICLLPILIAAVTLSPGLLVLRRVRMLPAERLVAAVAVSLFVVYVMTFGAFIVNAPNGFAWVVTGIGAVATALAWPDIVGLFAHASVRRISIHFALLLAWFVLLSLTIRNFSGGLWGYDWAEHYQRALFFLHRFPLKFRFVPNEALPSRPPMMNVIAAHFMAQAGSGYEVYQLTAVYLNSLAVLPCYLLGKYFGGRRYSATLLTIVLALNPLVTQNATFAWTKMFAAFYVVSAMWFYVAGFRRRDSARMVVAFSLLAMGTLVHYSAGIFVVLVSAHFLVVALWRMRRPAKLFVSITAISGAILATWFGWSLAIYGRTTFSANTTVQGSSKYSVLSNGGKVLSNIYHTLVPHPIGLGYAEFAGQLAQPTSYGKVRDYFFMMYEPNLIIAIGSVGGLLVIDLLIRAMGRRRLPGFWLYFVAGAIILGPAVHGEPDYWGVTHVCLQPLVLIGLTFMAARARAQPAWFRIALAIGIVIDALFGVLLQFYCCSRVFRMVDPMRSYDVIAGSDTMNMTALTNYAGKIRSGWTFVGDRLGDTSRHALYALIVLITAWMLVEMVRQLRSAHFVGRRSK